MRRNVGETDQVTRLAIGSAALVVAVAAGGAWMWLCVVTAVLYLTAVYRVCPLYTVFGWSSVRARSQHGIHEVK